MITPEMAMKSPGLLLGEITKASHWESVRMGWLLLRSSSRYGLMSH